MRVLVLNAGSSSLKYALLDADDRPLVEGTVERIGEAGGDTPDHAAAVARVTDALAGARPDARPDAIGHRVVHGGAALTAPTVIDDEVVEVITRQVPLAPLHNPANLTGIAAARGRWPDLPQVAVFDTAFHATIPPAAHRYALPAWTLEDHGVRRYGFHGTSHAWVSRRAIAHLGDPPDSRVVTLHLGNGASAAAVRAGRCVDTSMGLSPLEGLVMGTRSGDVDPAVVFHLARQADLSLDEVEALLTRGSGMKGMAGDNDMRTVHRRAVDGDPDATLAIEVYVHRIRRYVGAFAAVLGGLDALVFTAGVGEHAPDIRARVCADLDHLGVAVDAGRNAEVIGPEGTEAIGTGPTAVLVVPTDEEAEIAGQTRQALTG